MNTTVRGTSIAIVVADITELDVDAIVSVADERLWMDSGIAATIKAAGGEQIEHEATAQGPIEPGDAVATTGGSLHAKWIVHAAVTGKGVETDANLVARCTTRAFEVADRVGVRSVALPMLSAGLGGVSVYACATIMVGQARQYLATRHSSGLRRVLLCAADDVERAAFGNALAGTTRFD